MADLHESLIRSFRRKVIRGGLQETKSPMPTYKPDIFAERTSPSGSVVEQVAVEAEIKSTLFNEHTSHQLLILDEFIRHQKAKRIRVKGYLLVPRGTETRTHAHSLLDTLFPDGTAIRVIEAA
jgi:hypothetical protein